MTHDKQHTEILSTDEECRHENLNLSCLEDTVHCFNSVEKKWVGVQTPTGIHYLTSGHCLDCGKELSVLELRELTGRSVFGVEFKEATD